MEEYAAYVRMVSGPVTDDNTPHGWRKRDLHRLLSFTAPSAAAARSRTTALLREWPDHYGEVWQWSPTPASNGSRGQLVGQRSRLNQRSVRGQQPRADRERGERGD